MSWKRMKPVVYTKEEIESNYLAQKLYELSVAAYKSGSGSAWTKQQFLSNIENKHTYYFLVIQEEIWVGFICYQRILDEAELLNLVVHPSYQKNGFGKLLLNHAIQQMNSQQIKKVFLEVRESNLSARQLYEKQKFIQITTRKKYYHQPTEDGIIMCLAIEEV